VHLLVFVLVTCTELNICV